MNSRATGKFWQAYHALPPGIQKLAVKQYVLWRENPAHPSVQFKKVGRFWSARVTDNYRVLGVMDGDTVVWFWIGVHDEYGKVLGRK
jgi:hypothetical protein